MSWKQEVLQSSVWGLCLNIKGTIIVSIYFYEGKKTERGKVLGSQKSPQNLILEILTRSIFPLPAHTGLQHIPTSLIAHRLKPALTLTKIFTGSWQSIANGPGKEEQRILGFSPVFCFLDLSLFRAGHWRQVH